MLIREHIQEYCTRVEQMLESYLPDARLPPERLHSAMRYSVLGGGKRLRPALVYATGQALSVHRALLDAPAAAIELLHAYSLVHDDLPAMDDDDLRRGMPTTHRKYGVATAILAADALQPLAFRLLTSHSPMLNQPALQIKIIKTLADACGSNGMTGGQAIDLASEGKQLYAAELENMYRLKTGRLLHASVMSAAYCAKDLNDQALKDLERFIDALGIAFQICDDILDVEGSTEQIGKQSGADDAKQKATYPSLFGLERARARTDDLLTKALAALDQFGQEADVLREVAKYIVRRER
jgi:farnesyl diphosphate synthase